MGLWLVASYLQAADVVHLKNGRSVSGVIREETSSHVVLELGAGSMTLPRSRIKAIERADPSERERTREEWRDRHWLNVRYVPAGFNPLAARLRAVIDERQAVVQARGEVAQDGAARRKLDQRLHALHRRMVEAAHALEAVDRLADPAGYNARVVEHNRLQAERAQLENTRQQLDERRRELQARIHDYRDALQALRGLVTEYAQGAASEASERFLVRATEILAKYESEFESEDITVDQEPGGLVVTALIDGKLHGRFIVDTGAGMVTLTQAFADKLGLAWRHLPEGQATLADGQRVEARYVTLDSVQVGQRRVAGVHAAVLPASAQKSVDGLLGMSFLRHFHMSLDGASGRLILHEFSP